MAAHPFDGAEQTPLDGDRLCGQVMATAGDAVIVVNRAGMIVLWNM